MNEELSEVIYIVTEMQPNKEGTWFVFNDKSITVLLPSSPIHAQQISALSCARAIAYCFDGYEASYYIIFLGAKRNSIIAWLSVKWINFLCLTNSEESRTIRDKTPLVLCIQMFSRVIDFKIINCRLNIHLPASDCQKHCAFVALCVCVCVCPDRQCFGKYKG